MLRPDRDWCRDVGLHLPRNIYPSPNDPNLTREVCLRCGVWLARRRDDGREVEVIQYTIRAEKVTVR